MALEGNCDTGENITIFPSEAVREHRNVEKAIRAFLQGMGMHDEAAARWIVADVVRRWDRHPRSVVMDVQGDGGHDVRHRVADAQCADGHDVRQQLNALAEWFVAELTLASAQLYVAQHFGLSSA